MRRLFLLSNSVNPGMGFLEHAEQPIKGFLGDDIKRVLFVPYAGVTMTFDSMTERVGNKFGELGYTLESIHKAGDAVEAVMNADAIAVSGGNTFHLLAHMYKYNLLDAVRERVAAGVPYMGWSAGSNLACPTLKTTNDMPIVEPESFNSLGLVPFQINPHYTDARLEGHGGETREQRIQECIEVNRDVYVAGLREGCALRVEGDDISLLGERQLRVFKFGSEPREFSTGDDITFLMGG